MRGAVATSVAPAEAMKETRSASPPTRANVAKASPGGMEARTAATGAASTTTKIRAAKKKARPAGGRVMQEASPGHRAKRAGERRDPEGLRHCAGARARCLRGQHRGRGTRRAGAAKDRDRHHFCLRRGGDERAGSR